MSRRIKPSQSGKGSATGRYLAMFVALAFALIAILQISLYLTQPTSLHGTAIPWIGIVIISGYILGATSLFLGAILWYNGMPQFLRLIGFLALLLFSLMNVSFAFFLIPIALLSVFSLSKHERGELSTPSTIGPIVIIVAGSILLLLSMTLPWFDWVSQNNDMQVGLWEADKLIAFLILIATLFPLASLPLGFMIRGQLVEFLTLTASILVLSMVIFRVLVPASAPNVISIGLGPGIIMGLVGAAILVLGAVVNLVRSKYQLASQQASILSVYTIL